MESEIFSHLADIRPAPERIDTPEPQEFGGTPFNLRELQKRHHARIEAAVQDLKQFFGAEEANTLVSLALNVSINDFLMAQRALVTLLDGWRVVHECRYNDFEAHVPSLVERCAVEVAPKTFEFVIRDGRQYWVGPQGEKMAVDLNVYQDRKEPTSTMTFLVPHARHDWLRDLIPRIRERMDADHFLRGRAFTANGTFIDFTTPTAWDDIFLPAHVRQSIERNCIELLRYADLFKANGIPLRRGIVLHGKPGTGKTMIGQALAQRCGVTFILATPGMLSEPSDVRRVFTWARRLAPTILFFEDFDLVAGSRHATATFRGMLGEFLSCLDGIDSSEGVITIATTNDLQSIEGALRDRPNRFDCLLEIPTLEREQRIGYLERWREKHAGFYDSGAIADRTEGFTGAQLQELCRLAVFEAVADRVSQNRSEAVLLPLSGEHFDRAFGKVPSRPGRRIGFCLPEPEPEPGEDDTGSDDLEE